MRVPTSWPMSRPLSLEPKSSVNSRSERSRKIVFVILRAPGSAALNHSGLS